MNQVLGSNFRNDPKELATGREVGNRGRSALERVLEDRLPVVAIEVGGSFDSVVDGTKFAEVLPREIDGSRRGG